jgi:hypothetical protein
MGARGRKTRYSSWKIATISAATKMEVSTTLQAEHCAGGSPAARGALSQPFGSARSCPRSSLWRLK